MQEFKPFKEGKVREIYDNGDSLIMVATDRISAFDNILKNDIVDKGAILTQLSKFWFDLTEDIVPNHLISVDTNDMPEFFRNEKFARRSTMCRKLDMLPLECIVRGYITGGGWASYKNTGEICGIKLPEGLKESEKLSQFTHRVPRLSWENTMRISPMRRALRCWKRLIRVEVRSWPRRLRSSHFLYIRSVQITHWREVLSSLIPSLSSVWTRMATWCLRMKC